MRVRIKKISAVEGADCPTVAPGVWKCGQDNGDVSPPVEYEVEGELLWDVAVGRPCLLYRDKRNGVAAYGVFKTSRVTSVTDTGFTTLNSVYEMERLDGESDTEDAETA